MCSLASSENKNKKEPCLNFDNAGGKDRYGMDKNHTDSQIEERSQGPE